MIQVTPCLEVVKSFARRNWLNNFHLILLLLMQITSWIMCLHWIWARTEILLDNMQIICPKNYTKWLLNFDYLRLGSLFLKVILCEFWHEVPIAVWVYYMISMIIKVSKTISTQQWTDIFDISLFNEKINIKKMYGTKLPMLK